MRNAKRGDFPSMDMLENLASSEGFVIGVKNGGFFRSLKPCILIQGHLRPPHIPVGGCHTNLVKGAWQVGGFEMEY